MIVLFGIIIVYGAQKLCPFLIGKVITGRKMKNFKKLFLCPFLIGKVITINIRNRTTNFSSQLECPFLIGKVITQSEKGS